MCKIQADCLQKEIKGLILVVIVAGISVLYPFLSQNFEFMPENRERRFVTLCNREMHC